VTVADLHEALLEIVVKLDVLEDIRDDQRRLIELLQQQPSHQRAAFDERHVALLAAIADAMQNYDLEFNAAEVVTEARRHHALAEALEALRIDDVERLGLLFRKLRDHVVGGFVLVRYERCWRLRRTS